MEVVYLLTFLGGTIVGLVIAMMLSTLRAPEDRDVDLDPNLRSANCQSNGQVLIDGTAGATLGNLTLVNLYSAAYATLPVPLPEQPPVTAAGQGVTFPIPSTPLMSSGYIVVWTEYRGYGKQAIAFHCPNAAPAKNKVNHFVPKALDLDAFPASYRIEPPATSGSATGAAAQLVGLLPKSAGTVLRHVVEASSPAEPLWRALGGTGPVFEATLALLHRTGGIGAVLTISAVLGDRRVQLSWVTSNWSFHEPNRLRCESDEPGLPVLVVLPA